jgi:sarcosine oxidase subunit alpha
MIVEEQHGVGTFPETTVGDYETAFLELEADFVIIGGGPAGLSAALEAADLGMSVLLLDENHQLGGQLIKQTHRFFGSKEHDAGVRGVTIARSMIEKVEASDKIRVLLSTTAFGYYPGGVIATVKENKQLVKITGKRVLLATGAAENSLAFPMDCTVPKILSSPIRMMSGSRFRSERRSKRQEQSTRSTRQMQSKLSNPSMKQG